MGMVKEDLYQPPDNLVQVKDSLEQTTCEYLSKAQQYGSIHLWCGSLVRFKTSQPFCI